MPYEFDSEIMRLPGKIKWNVFYFPYDAQELFGSKGNIPVCVTVDGRAFDHMLLPSKNGHYLVYNEFVRRAVGKDIGDVVHVTLERDTKKRELVIPAYIGDALEDAGALEAFQKLPAYERREAVNHIELAKKEETKANRLAALVKNLCGEPCPHCPNCPKYPCARIGRT